MRSFQSQINEIMENFDFKRVAQVMKTLNWTWGDELEPPNIDVIRSNALERLENAVEVYKERGKKRLTTSCGGFQVNIIKGWMELQFVVEEWEAYSDEGD